MINFINHKAHEDLTDHCVDAGQKKGLLEYATLLHNQLGRKHITENEHSEITYDEIQQMWTQLSGEITEKQVRYYRKLILV